MQREKRIGNNGKVDIAIIENLYVINAWLETCAFDLINLAKNISVFLNFNHINNKGKIKSVPYGIDRHTNDES